MYDRVEVQYEKPHSADLKRIPGAVWTYHIKECSDPVHGFAGGLLTQTVDKLWVAHYWQYEKGEAAKTREQAIRNVLPAAAAHVAAWRKQQEQYSQAYEARHAFARTLQEKFRKILGREVSVFDKTAERDKESPAAMYKVTVTFENATLEDVEYLAKNV